MGNPAHTAANQRVNNRWPYRKSYRFDPKSRLFRVFPCATSLALVLVIFTQNPLARETPTMLTVSLSTRHRYCLVSHVPTWFQSVQSKVQFRITGLWTRVHVSTGRNKAVEAQKYCRSTVKFAVLADWRTELAPVLISRQARRGTHLKNLPVPIIRSKLNPPPLALDDYHHITSNECQEV